MLPAQLLVLSSDRAQAQSQAQSQAQAQAQDSDPVVAIVNGETILRSEVVTLVERLPAQYQAQLGALMPQLIDQLVNTRLLTNAAEDAGLAEDDEVLRRLEIRKEAIMRDVYLERHLEAQITNDKLGARYDAFVSDTPRTAEVRARHILLETEEAAREVIATLDKGADFAELAQSRSTGPSAAQGGDLGYFTKERMVPEFSSAAFAMDVGSHSAEPVQSQFGWHVIKVEDRRDQPPPTFHDVEDQLREDLTREIVQAKVTELRGGAEIEQVMDPAAILIPGAQ